MKRFICTLLVTLLLLGTLPMSAFGASALPADVNLALNAEGSQIAFSVDEPDRWTAVNTSSERYAQLISPLEEEDDDETYVNFTVEIPAGGYFLVDVVSYQSNGKCDCELYDGNEMYGYYSNIVDGETKTLAIRSDEGGTYDLTLYMDFDSVDLTKAPMYMRASNARVTTEAPKYTVSFVDYRTLKTFASDEVDLFQDASLPVSSLIPIHEGYELSHWDNLIDLEYVTEDRTIYAHYALEGTVENQVVFVQPSGTEAAIGEFALPEGVSLLNDTDYPWTAKQSDEGYVYIQSSTTGIPDSQTAVTLNLTDIEEDRVLLFDFYVEAEENCDYLWWDAGTFYEYSTMPSWQTAIIPLRTGNSSITLNYRKDGSVNRGLDSAFIKNIRVLESWDVTYKYVDSYTNEIFAEGTMGIGEEPPYVLPPEHEGMRTLSTVTEQDADYNVTITVYYYEDLDAAAIMEGSNLTVRMPDSDTDGEPLDHSYYTVEEEEDRSFIRFSVYDDSDTASSAIWVNSLTEMNNPVLVFEYRAMEDCRIGIDGNLSSIRQFVEASDEWKTMYCPATFSLNAFFDITAWPMLERTVVQLAKGDPILDIDNIRIVEGDNINLTYSMTVGENTQTDTRPLKQYTRLDHYYNPFSTVPEGWTFFGYQQRKGELDADYTAEVKLVKKDLSTIFADPMQTDILIQNRTDIYDQMTFTEATLAGKNALSTTLFSGYEEGRTVTATLELEIANAATPYLAVDVYVGSEDMLHVGVYPSRTPNQDERAAFDTRELIYDQESMSEYQMVLDTHGEWVTVYLPVQTGMQMVITTQRADLDIATEGKTPTVGVDNLRFVAEPPKVTVTFVDDATRETLGTVKYFAGTSIYTIMANLTDIPLEKGYAITSRQLTGDVPSVLKEDVTLGVIVEPIADIAPALNAEGRGIEFEVYNFYPWKLASMDGRSVIAANDKCFYGRGSTFDFDGELAAGDTISFDYKLISPNGREGLALSIYEEGSDTNNYFVLEQTDEWATESYVVKSTGEVSIGLFVTNVDRYLARETALDEGCIIAVDNFKIVPAGPKEPVRAIYGSTLGELKGHLPEGWSWMDESIIPDVVNGGYKANFVAPADEKMYSSTVEAGTVETIILPLDLQEPLSITAVAKNGTLASVALPSSFEWATPDTVITAFKTPTLFEATVNREGIDPRNFIGDGTEFSILLTAYDMGDCDLSGEVTAADASSILRHIVKLITLEDLQKQAGDIDQSGDLEASDAAKILRFIVKLQSTLHITP